MSGRWRIDPAELGQARSSRCSRPTRGGGWRSTTRAASARSTWCRPTSSDDWPAVRGARARAARTSTRAELQRRARRAKRGDQAAAARPADRRRPRQHLRLRGALPRRDRIRRGPAGSISLERLERLVAGDPGGARRGDRGGRLDACATMRQPDGELGYFSKSFAVYDREGAALRAAAARSAHRPGRPLDLLLPALPALRLDHSGLCWRRGAPVPARPRGSRRFFIEPTG